MHVHIIITVVSKFIEILILSISKFPLFKIAVKLAVITSSMQKLKNPIRENKIYFIVRTPRLNLIFTNKNNKEYIGYINYTIY